MKKGKYRYFSFDKIPYLFESMEESLLPSMDESIIDPDLKVAG
jgi:hypothetical protein